MTRKLKDLWREFGLMRRARRIAATLESQCWSEVRAKAIVLPPRQAEEYIRAHAANLVHREVDLLMRRNAALTGDWANKLVVRSTLFMTDRMCRRLASTRKAA